MLVIAVCVALVLLDVQIPAWLAVLGFGVLALFQGMLVAAVADILTA
jgi:hypothetical protein